MVILKTIMSMNPRNIILLLKRTFDSREYDVESIITDEEKALAVTVENLIKDAVDAQIFIDSVDTLSFNEESVHPEGILIDEFLDSDSEESINGCKKSVIEIDIDYKRKAVDFWRSGKRKPLPLKSVQHSFKKVSSLRSLYRWEEQLKEGGTRNEKLLEISKRVLEQFKIASERSLPIHDIDIKRWALRAREEIQLSQELFTASNFWVHNFKVKYGIVSRKINKFVTQKQISSKETLSQACSKFVTKVKAEIGLVGEDNVFNSDQSGFTLETHAGRTLALKGSLKVECLAQSLNCLTHSYTIQPIVSASGDLMSPLLIVLPETGGKFGPIVETTLYKANNIVVFPSKSGKLTSDLAINWFTNAFLPATGEKSVLLLDSWTGQTEKKFDNIDKGNKNVKILTIPAGTTGQIQPLDVYTFRPWKNFLRQFSDIIMLYNYDVNLHLRNNILKIQSLIHNQFSSPRFKNIFRYAWWKSGYIAEKPDKCETPSDFCLKNCDGKCQLCNDIAIITCGWCMTPMCIQHFFAITDDNSPHYCSEFKV